MVSWYHGIMVSCWHHGAIELPKSPFLSVFGFPDLAEGASLEMAIRVFFLLSQRAKDFKAFSLRHSEAWKTFSDPLIF